MKLRVKIDDQTFEVEVGDLNERPIIATVDGEVIEVWPEETQIAEPAIFIAPSSHPVATHAPVQTTLSRPTPTNGIDASRQVTAPIPGTIVSIAVQVASSVNPGQELLSLEAMKMKNVIRASRSGQIAKILVKPGDRVSQGQPLIEYAA